MTTNTHNCVRGDQVDIPYDDIDPPIRWLVRELNDVQGITTLYSCAGHGGEDDWIKAYIEFKVACISALEALFLRFRDIDVQWRKIRGDRKMAMRVGFHKELGLVFTLLIVAKGLKNHRNYLEGVEGILKEESNLCLSRRAN